MIAKGITALNDIFLITVLQILLLLFGAIVLSAVRADRFGYTATNLDVNDLSKRKKTYNNVRQFGSSSVVGKFFFCFYCFYITNFLSR